MIFAEHNRGNSQRASDLLLGRLGSTIGRELARGRQADCIYCPHSARLVYDSRRTYCRRSRKLTEGGDLHQIVYDHLIHHRWSPEHIAQRIQLMKHDDSSARVSHETIYAQPCGSLMAAMIEALRQRKPVRGRRRTISANSYIVPETLRIINCPDEIKSRLVIGHLEGDS